MGLLDFFQSTGDPERDQARNMGLLQAGMSLLASRGNFANALGQAGMAGLQGAQQYRDNRFQQQQRQMQMDEWKRQQAMRALPGQFMKPGMRPPTMDDRDVGQPGEQAIPAQQFDYGGYADALAKYDPNASIQMRAALSKDETPVALGDGGMLVTRSGRVLASNPKDAKEPEDIRALKLIYGEGTPQYKAALERLGAKKTTHQPATTVNVSTDKALGTTLAEGLGKQIDASLASAKTAVGSIDTAHRLKAAVDSGKLVAGPGSSFRVLGLQLGQMMGISGKNAAETLSNTRTAIQSMAQAELDAAQQMKGQGQITEAERDIIRRAASGNIDALTGPEVRILADSLEKVARNKIKAHRSNVDRMKGVKGAETLLPFYQLDEPAAYAKPGGFPGVDSSAIDAELRRRGR